MNDNQVYEVGFLLSPFLPEAEAAEKLESLIKGKITAAQGTILSTVEARMMPLAYPMAKVIENKKTVYRDAYFGAVKFELSPEAIERLGMDWKRAPEVIRHLIIKTSKEIYQPPTPAVPPAPEAVVEPVPAVPAETILNEAVDREIAGMLAS